MWIKGSSSYVNLDHVLSIYVSKIGDEFEIRAFVSREENYYLLERYDSREEAEKKVEELIYSLNAPHQASWILKK